MAVFYKPNSGQKRTTLKAGDLLINTSTFKPAHCGIVVKNQDIIHATNKGIVSTDVDIWGQEADLFRPAVDLSDEDAAAIDGIANEIRDSASYGLGRAVFKSTFSLGYAGSGLQKRLSKYRERLQNHQGVVKNVYCSELVILCYQLFRNNDDHPLFIKLDGKHTWPSTLRRYLKGNTNWKHLGQYQP